MRIIALILTLQIIILNHAICQNNKLSESKGYTTIYGKVRNFEKYQKGEDVIQLGIGDWTIGDYKYYFAKIDSSGEFFISFYINNPQDAFLSLMKKQKSLMIFPNDTLTLEIDAHYYPDSIQYIGKTAKLCADLSTCEKGYRNIVDKYKIDEPQNNPST
jgi:hypothetical protein